MNFLNPLQYLESGINDLNNYLNWFLLIQKEASEKITKIIKEKWNFDKQLLKEIVKNILIKQGFISWSELTEENIKYSLELRNNEGIIAIYIGNDFPEIYINLKFWTIGDRVSHKIWIIIPSNWPYETAKENSWFLPIDSEDQEFKNNWFFKI